MYAILGLLLFCAAIAFAVTVTSLSSDFSGLIVHNICRGNSSDLDLTAYRASTARCATPRPRAPCARHRILMRRPPRRVPAQAFGFLAVFGAVVLVVVMWRESRRSEYAQAV